MNNIMAEKLKIKIPEGFKPKENCVACNGTVMCGKSSFQSNRY